MYDKITINNKVIKMPKERTIAPRIIYVFQQNNNIGMRFSEIFKKLAQKGWLHSQHPISDNLKFLIEQGEVAHIKNQYCPIQTREDGTKFVVIKNPVETVVELE